MNSGNELWIDPIVDEVQRVRNHYAALFNYDLQALVADLQEQERCSDREFVSYPARVVSGTE